MKKIFLATILVLSLVLSIVGCSGTPQEPIENPQENPQENPPVEITYTDEFPYLPKHPSMVLKELQKGSPESGDYAFYTIPDAEYETFFVKYEEILKQDGWSVTIDEKPNGLGVAKDDHMAAMTVNKTAEGTMMVINSK